MLLTVRLQPDEGGRLVQMISLLRFGYCAIWRGCPLCQPNLIGIGKNVLLELVAKENRKSAAQEHNQHRNRHSPHKGAFQGLPFYFSHR